MKYLIFVLLVIVILMQSDSLAVQQTIASYSSWLDTAACKLGMLDGFQCSIVDFNNQVQEAMK